MHGITSYRLVLFAILLFTLALTASLAAPAYAQGRDSLEFVDSSTISITVSAQTPDASTLLESVEFTRSLTVRNNTTRTVTVGLSALLFDPDGKFQPATIRVLDEANKEQPRQDSIGVAAGRVVAINYVLAPQPPVKLPLSGHLIATAADGLAQPATRHLELKPLQPSPWMAPSLLSFVPDAATGTILISLALSLLCSGLLWVLYQTPKQQDGTPRKFARNLFPAWDPKQSFVSNFTAISAILTTILSAGVLPDKTVHIDKGGYQILSIFFGAILIIAPLVFNMTVETRKSVQPGAKDTDTEQYGRIWALRTTTSLVLWALLGEMIVIALIMNELNVAGRLPEFFINLFLILLVISVLLVLWYIRSVLPKVVGTGDDPSVLAEVGENVEDDTNLEDYIAEALRIDTRTVIMPGAHGRSKLRVVEAQDNRPQIVVIEPEHARDHARPKYPLF
jgi:hypothetical protein